jgi:hypothetical protein
MRLAGVRLLRRVRMLAAALPRRREPSAVLLGHAGLRRAGLRDTRLRCA